MAIVSVTDKDFWLEFISKYRSLPCLWNVYIPEYSNKHLREEALQTLVEKCKEINPSVSKDYVRKRIANLRTAFGREFKKIEKSKRTGSAAENVYVPNLWYFNELLFLKDTETIREGSSSLTCSTDEDPYEYSDFHDNFSDDLFASPHTPGENSSSSTVSHSTNSVRKKKNLSLDQQQKQFFEKASEFMCEKPQIKTDDEFDILGKRIAVHFRNMEENQRLLAEKIVSDVLISGRMGQLNQNSIFVLNSDLQETNQEEAPIVVDTTTFVPCIQQSKSSYGNEDLSQFLYFNQGQGLRQKKL